MSTRDEKPGRGAPVMGREPKARYQVMIEPRVAERLRKLGGGNLSAGIAAALEAATRKGRE